MPPDIGSCSIAKNQEFQVACYGSKNDINLPYLVWTFFIIMLMIHITFFQMHSSYLFSYGTPLQLYQPSQLEILHYS